MTGKANKQLHMLMIALLWWTAAVPVVAQKTGNPERLRQEARDPTNAARAEEGLSKPGPNDIFGRAVQARS